MPPTRTDTYLTPAPKRIPEPYLRAEITSYPLGSEASFQLCLTELDPRLGQDGRDLRPGQDDQDPTGRLWRDCEGRLAQHTGWSLDRLVASRDRGWFGTAERIGRVSLRTYLRRLALAHLMPRPGCTEIAENPELSALDAIVHYRWLTLVLPEDLLLAALGVEPAPISVDLDPPMLRRRLLDLGVAEIHQHVGAAMDFTLLWASALTALASPAVDEAQLASPGAPFEDGRYLVRWLLVAAIARCVLAEHLIQGGESIGAFIRRRLTTPSAMWTRRRRETLLTALDALVSGKDDALPEIERLRDLYSDLHPAAATLGDRPIERLEDAYRRLDPIACRLDLHGPNAGERWLTRQALAYLGPRGDGWDGDRHDPAFARIFWQTVRLRCQYYRAVVERPLTGGLQWFIRFYDRLGTLRAPLNAILPEVSFRHAAANQGIKALELRTSPEDTAIGNGEYLLHTLHSWRRVLQAPEGVRPNPELGLVLHYVKTRDAGDAWKRGRPPAFWAGTHDEPGKGSPQSRCGRYIEYFAKQAGRARALAELIDSVPSCLWLLRGLDVATDELGVPTWVLVPLFRHVVDASAAVSVREGAGPPLQLTAHVGEDFRHLLEGLRRIYEQVHYVLGGRGGRLGHAIALGIDPQAWAESVGSVLMPAEERLWDLVWEWRLYSRFRIRPEYAASAPSGRAAALTTRIDALSGEIFGGRHYRIEALAEAQHTLHQFLVPPYARRIRVDGGDDTFREAVRALDRRQVLHLPQVRSILTAHLEDESVFRRGQELIDCPADAGEVTALLAVQRTLRTGIAQSGIVVEANPSSNLLIGDLLDLRSHPILRLFPPVPGPDDPPPVPIALGSDDPLTFSTRLVREYSLLYRSAIAAGYPERVANDWLEAIRRTGMDARFTLEWLPDPITKVQRLMVDLEAWLHQPRP